MRFLAEQLNSLWRRKWLLIVVLSLQIILNMICPFLSNSVQIAMMASSGVIFLLLSLYAIYTQRSNMLAVLLNILILYFNYSLVASIYWNTDGLEHVFYRDKYVWSEFLHCINIILLFFGMYVLFLEDKPHVDRKVYRKQGAPNYVIVAACTLYIAAAPFLFYQTESFGARGVITPLYEYSLIVMIVGMIFTRRRILALTPLFLASSWMILHGLMHGERISALQMMIVWGIYLLLHVLSLKLIIPACLAGVFLFTIFGIFRGVADLDGNFLMTTFKRLLNGGLVNDTAYHAYWAGMSIVRFAEITPFYERILYFLRYVVYVFFGSGVSDADLSSLSSMVNVHVGGGWLPFYAFYWLGYAGVIFSGLGLAKLFNYVTGLQENKTFSNFLAIYLVATIPRWYLYTPTSLTRGVMFFTLFYLACFIGDKVLMHVYLKIKERFKARKA